MRTSYIDFNDADHVRRTLHGDKAAFDALVQQYHGMVYTIGLARLNQDHDQADELAQEVFLRAWLHLDRLTRPDYFPAWLVQITRNLAADWQRRDRRKSALVQLLGADHPEVLAVQALSPSPRETLAAANETKKLQLSLDQLPTEQRELLLLHYGEGLSQSEIARNLGVRPSTVMRRLDKALTVLRQAYKHQSAPELAMSGSASNHRLPRTLAVMAAAFLLPLNQKSALAAAAGTVIYLPPIFPLKKALAIGAVGISAAAVVVIMFGNYSLESIRDSFTSQSETSPRSYKQSVEVRLVNSGKTALPDSDSGTEKQGHRHKEFLKSESNEAHASTPSSSEAESPAQEHRTLANETGGQSGMSNAAPAKSDTSSNCPSLAKIVERIQQLEAIAGSAHFTYKSAVTVLNRNNEPDVRDREGTVTVKQGRYLIEVRESANRSQTIYHDLAKGEVTSVVNFEGPSVPGPYTVNVWRTEPQVGDLIRQYNPLAGLISPPFGADSLSDFVIKDSHDGSVSVTCSPETTESVVVGAQDWSMRFQAEQYPFFDQLQKHTETANGRKLEKHVTSVSSLDGIIYPSTFHTTSHGDRGVFGAFENATTTSITMLKLGDAVPPVKDPFANLPDAKRFDMISGEFITASDEVIRPRRNAVTEVPAGSGSSAAGAPDQSKISNSRDTTRSSRDSTPTMAQKFRDPQIARENPRSGIVTGQVLDAEGRPVPDLDIDWAALTQQPAEERQKLLSKLPPNAAVSNQPVQQVGRSSTDSNGNFAINFPTTGTAVLATDYEPHARTLHVIDMPTTGLTITIPARGATVRGTVRDITTGEPVSDAHVRLTPLANLEFDTGGMGVQTFKRFAGTGVHLTTDLHGKFRDDRMPSAETSGEAATDTLIPVKAKYLYPDNPVLTAGTTTQMYDLYVYPGYTLRGYALEAGTSRPLAGVTVEPAGGLGSLTGKRPEAVTTDASGYYEITRLQPLGGDVRSDGEAPRLTFEYISARADGFKSERFAPRVTGTFNPRQLIIEHNFELTRGTEAARPESELQRFHLPRL